MQTQVTVKINASGLQIDPEITIDVEYKIFGKYYPATRNSPAEYPEVDIQKITLVEASDLDNEPIDVTTLTEDQRNQIIAAIDSEDLDNLLLDKAENEAENDRADYEIDAYEDRKSMLYDNIWD